MMTQNFHRMQTSMNAGDLNPASYEIGLHTVHRQLRWKA